MSHQTFKTATLTYNELRLVHEDNNIRSEKMINDLQLELVFIHTIYILNLCIDTTVLACDVRTQILKIS